MPTRKNILICPLEWGLGHAGRMVPVARELLTMGNNVFIGSGKNITEFFRKELPELSYIHFPGFRMKYSAWLPQYAVIFFRTPLFVFSVIKEHFRLKRIIRNYDIDIVISDSRIGLWNRDIPTAVVTHMIRIPHPRGLQFLEKIALEIARRIIRKFDLCLIPDLPGEVNISGKLSHHLPLPANARYSGLLSRFEKPDTTLVGTIKKYFCAVILSGPEPQKSILREKMEKILNASDKSSVILEGSPSGELRRSEEGKITYINHLPAKDFGKIILESENIVTRSGYTTLMELISLRRSALLIPTPGQPEQEYLAEYLANKGWFRKKSQKDLLPGTDIMELNATYPEMMMRESEELLNASLTELLEK